MRYTYRGYQIIETEGGFFVNLLRDRFDTLEGARDAIDQLSGNAKPDPRRVVLTALLAGLVLLAAALLVTLFLN